MANEVRIKKSVYNKDEFKKVVDIESYIMKYLYKVMIHILF
jgi:hypothetical protein